MGVVFFVDIVRVVSRGTLLMMSVGAQAGRRGVARLSHRPRVAHGDLEVLIVVSIMLRYGVELVASEGYFTTVTHLNIFQLQGLEVVFEALAVLGSWLPHAHSTVNDEVHLVTHFTVQHDVAIGRMVFVAQLLHQFTDLMIRELTLTEEVEEAVLAGPETLLDLFLSALYHG